jgi:hypothetical protein
MPENATPATVLRDAAGRIRTRGHHRGAFVAPDGGAVCAVGAIYDVRDRDWLVHHASGSEAFEALLFLEEFVQEHIPLWNDRIAQGGEDVAATMEKCAAWWEETHA